jgi:hypothetical protein
MKALGHSTYIGTYTPGFAILFKQSRANLHMVQQFAEHRKHRDDLLDMLLIWTLRLRYELLRIPPPQSLPGGGAGDDINIGRVAQIWKFPPE